MPKIKICERCKQKIRPKVEDYFQVDTYERGKKIKEGYLHKKCNADMNKEKKVLGELLGKVIKLSDHVEKTIGIPQTINFEVKP